MGKFKEFLLSVGMALTFLPWIISMYHGMMHSNEVTAAIGYIGIVIWPIVVCWITDKFIVK